MMAFLFIGKKKTLASLCESCLVDRALDFTKPSIMGSSHCKIRIDTWIILS
mgnify:CR=1 FL=1